MVGEDLSGALATLVRGEPLDEERAAAVLDTIMEGGARPAQVAGLLVALAAKGESDEEIAGLARAMRRHATGIAAPANAIDTCGTGGDGAGTFNVSTVAALVAAAGGVPVAKHGNRAASSSCGSADLLEAWGVAIELTAEAAEQVLRDVGITFLYARSFHPAMRYVAPVRSALGVPTVFNVLGPLTNPARVSRQVVGVADRRLAPVVAGALARLGHEHALVVRSEDGLDELTTTATNRLWEVRGGMVEESRLAPEDLGLAPAEIDDLAGGDITENRRIADAVLAGEPGARGDVVVLNAAAALYVGGVVEDLGAGVTRARELLDSGAAAEVRDRWVARSQELDGAV